MTLLGKKDGDDGVSCLNLSDFLVRHGAQVSQDLEQLWRRILFYVCVSNTDDYLRNHGFMLKNNGWVLSLAYDINPVASGGGLSLRCPIFIHVLCSACPYSYAICYFRDMAL